MTIGIIVSWLAVIIAMPASLYLLMRLCDACFWAFCWCFCTVDNHLQDRHWQNLHRKKIETDRLLKMFAEPEEMAA